MTKQANGFAAAPVLLLVAVAAIGLFFLKQQLKPVPVTPPMYKVGECGKNSHNPDADSDQESDGTVWKVIAVGKKNYEMLQGEYRDKAFYVKLHKQSIETLDPGTEKIQCTKELNDPKTLEKAQSGR